MKTFRLVAIGSSGFSRVRCFTARHPTLRKAKDCDLDALVAKIMKYWHDVTTARILYSLGEDYDSLIFNDEMSFPFEVHASYIYEQLGISRAWVKSLGFEKMCVTVLFMFTGSGRKLGVWFVFAGEHGKRLAKSSSSWEAELLPGGDKKAFFFFRKPAWMSTSLYGRCLWQARKVWEEKYAKEGHPDPRQKHAHIVHDRAPAHTHEDTTALLKKLNMSETYVDPTALLQVLDVALARCIRAGYLRRQLEYFRDFPKTEGSPGVAVLRKLIVQWVCAAFYDDVPEELIVHTCRETGLISFDIDFPLPPPLTQNLR